MIENIFSSGDVNRLIGGNSDNGGLRNVNSDHPQNRNDNLGFRLVDSLSKILEVFSPAARHFSDFFKIAGKLEIYRSAYNLSFFKYAQNNFYEVNFFNKVAAGCDFFLLILIAYACCNFHQYKDSGINSFAKCVPFYLGKRFYYSMDGNIERIDSGKNGDFVFTLLGGVISHKNVFEEILSFENLICAWHEFKKGKTAKPDVADFSRDLEHNLFSLSEELKRGLYRHGPYESFFVHDPKRRRIHKAAVRDRVLHHAAVRIMNPIFDRRFIFDSYSCRKGKGVHAACSRFQEFAWKLSQNNTRIVWILKCDIRKFFDSVDHSILLAAIGRTIKNSNAMGLIKQIIESFEILPGKGLPLGNLTSQLFANVYLDEFDQYIKRVLRIKYYVRYCDDFILASPDRQALREAIKTIKNFLEYKLKLEIHPDKILLSPLHKGIDFLGTVHFPHYAVLRAKTQKRIFRRLTELKPKLGTKEFRASFNSYMGLMSHSRSYGIRRKIITSLLK